MDTGMGFLSVEAEIAALTEERSRGDAFEHVVAHFLRRDPTLDLRRVWSWRDWPGRGTAGIGAIDLGIDLVAEDAEGRVVGVQVKFRRDPDRLIRWEDVATAVGYRRGLFSRRLIVTNAWDRGPNARAAMETALGAEAEPIQWVLRDAFLVSRIDWAGALIADPSGDAAPELHIRMPRSHQNAAVADVVAALDTESRVQLIMACGSGKTLTALWIAEAREDARILVLVPSLLLLRQFRRDWIESARQPFADLVVCSDETTVGRDEIVLRTDDLGIAVTTDPGDIAAFLRGPGRRVVFSTYQSSARIAEAQADPDIAAFDLVVCDEAHKLAGAQISGDARANDQKVILDGAKIRASRRVFTTATPRLYGAGIKARLELAGADVEIASMDDATVFGPVAHRLSFRAAVEQGILVDYELIVIVVTDAEVADLIERRAIVQSPGLATDAESFGFLVALRRAISDLGLRRSISFHSSVARARAFARALPLISREMPIPATGHVAGTMPTGERNRIVELLRRPDVPTLVTNARCLTEGIDVPALDAVAFVDPRGSQVDIVQAVGRAMRTAPGKTRGRVILPVFLSEKESANPEAAVESSAFEPVLGVLRALRAHDGELSAEATRLRIELGARPLRLIDSRFLRDHVRVLDAAKRVDVSAFEQALDLRTVEVCAVPFDVGLGALRLFAERVGNARVPARFVEQGFQLGRWADHQRELRRDGALEPSRRLALETVPGWTWTPNEDDWRNGIERLRSYGAREGHLRVPLLHEEDGFRLGQWVANRRQYFRRGQTSAGRIEELELIHGWTWEPRFDDWETGLRALRSYVGRVGNANVPLAHHEDDYPLGRWVVKKRGARRQGRLAADRVQELEEVPGWTWDVDADTWEQAWRALQTYASREGHGRVPIDAQEGAFGLGHWVDSQRSRHREGLLDPGRSTRLESIAGWTWTPFDDDWDRSFDLLKVLVTRTGRATIAQAHVEDGFRLGAWVSRQRLEHRKGELSETRSAQLESLRGWTWNAVEDRWAAGLEHLKTYVAREGHARVPARHLEGLYPFGSWVTSRRVEYRAGRLRAGRIVVLQELAGWSWGSSRARPT